MGVEASTSPSTPSTYEVPTTQVDMHQSCWFRVLSDSSVSLLAAYRILTYLTLRTTHFFVPKQAPALPEKRKTRHGKELTLVLDLDETLVHCTVDPIVNPDHRFEVHFNGEEFQVPVPLLE